MNKILKTLSSIQLNKMENKMNAKKLWVSLLMLVSVLFLAASASAQVASSIDLEINGVDISEDPAIIVGDTVFIRIEFESLVNDSDVTIRAELEGDRERVEAETTRFDVESGFTYAKTLALNVPHDLRNEISGTIDLNIKISDTSLMTYELRVQRESFDLEVLSVNVPQTVEAGELFPVDTVLKNTGYNDLDDLFVTVRIPALGVERTTFFGDLVALECNDNDDSLENWGVDISRTCFEDKTDTASGRIFLDVPYDAKSGVYALEVIVEGDDVATSQTVKVEIANSFSEGNFIMSGNELLIVNPTNELVVYKLIPRNLEGTSISLSEELIAIPAGSSRTVTVAAQSTNSGENVFNIDVFTSDGRLVDTVTFNKALENENATSPIVVLTVILAIIFVILLVVLIVLLGKKPKTEEFGESYY